MTTVYKHADNVVLRNVAGECLLVPIRGSVVDMQQLFVLEGCGEFVWKHLDAERDLNDIVQLIVDEFDVNAEEAANDLQELTQLMSDAGLIEEVR